MLQDIIYVSYLLYLICRADFNSLSWEDIMGTRAVIGDWYLSEDNREQFEVVALDDTSGTIDVQFIDGSIGEFDLETWSQMEISPCPPPEDAMGPYESEFDEIDDTDESAVFIADDLGFEGMQIIHESEFEQWASNF
jgi:hypothetical protein